MAHAETISCPMCGADSPSSAVKCPKCGEAFARTAPPDALYRSAKRELIVSTSVWFTALVWSVGFSYRYGYHLKPGELTYVCGFPFWIFYGVVVPWGLCTVISGAIAFGFMQDADLGATDDSPTPEGN